MMMRLFTETEKTSGMIKGSEEILIEETSLMLYVVHDIFDDFSEPEQ